MVNSQLNGPTPVGYDALIARFSLQVIPNWHHSHTSQSNVRQTHTEGGQVVEVYPRFLTPEDSLGGHLEFALKYDGTNLEILSAVFEKASISYAITPQPSLRSRPSSICRIGSLIFSSV